MAAEEDREPEKASSIDAIPRGHGETILVIEDNDDVRALVQNMLTELCYRVVDAPDAVAARAAMATGPAIDLILSDVILPGGTSGPEFVEAVRTNVPETKVIFMSGYPTEAAKQNGFWESGTVLLSKPFQLGQLARALREALD